MDQSITARTNRINSYYPHAGDKDTSGDDTQAEQHNFAVAELVESVRKQAEAEAEAEADKPNQADAKT